MSVSCAAEETVGHAKRKPEICAEGGDGAAAVKAVAAFIANMSE